MDNEQTGNPFDGTGRFRQARMDNEQTGNPFDGTGRFRQAQARRPSSSVEENSLMERRYLIIVVPFLISCLYFIITKGSSYARAADTLEKAFIAFRHGSRAPTFSFESDEYRHNLEKYYPEGLDKLTNIGKKEAFELGKRLRERYDNFVGPIYKSNEVKVHTTLMDRTMMSGQLVMASFFPPQSYQVWSEELNWQPVPIYPEYIFNSTNGGSCPRYRIEAFANMHKSFKTLNPSEMEAVMHVVEHAGEPETSPHEVFARVWDTVYFQEKANLELPTWVKDVYPTKMTRAALHLVKGFLVGSDVQRYLIYGNYARALKDFFYGENNGKMEVHSWHDLNNIVLLSLLGVNVNFFPEPTSCIAIELHKKGEDKYFEVYYFDNYKSMEPRLLPMKCGESCPLDEIEKLLEKYKIENYHELCHHVTKSYPKDVPKLKILV